MSYKFHFWSVIFCLSIIPVNLEAQSIRKKTEISYRYINENDSVIQQEKIFEYDQSQRLIRKEERYYSGQTGSVLNKQIVVNFDSSKMLLTETVDNFNKNQQETERTKIKFLVYSSDDRKNKYQSKQYYDNADDLMKEDTLIYDQNYNLLSRCEFDYRGSTSQYCDIYSYNKKNQLKSWKMFVYWTTVNASSKPVTKRAKRQDYRYFYNDKGLPVLSKGTRYSTRFKEKYTYDENGKLESFTQQKIRIIKPSKKSNKQSTNATSNQKITKLIDLFVRKYKNGLLIYEQQVNSNKETQRIEIEYIGDSLPIKHTVYSKGILNKQTDFVYDASNRLSLKTTQNFDEKGILRNSLKNIYNEKGQLVEEQNYHKDILMSKMSITYDNLGQTTSISQYLKTKSDIYRKYESTFFFYEMY